MTTDLPPSTRPVTLEHVAKVAGVSRATVSRVVNGKSTVDPELRRVVEEAVAATNYVPNSAARSLVTRRTNSVALVVSEAERRNQPLDPFVGRMFTDPHFGRVVSGVIQVLRPQGMQMVLMLADDSESRSQLLGYLRQGHVDGVILVSSNTVDPLPQWLTEARIPAVLASRPASSCPIAYVDVDQREGVRLAVDHLVGLGRRRIATITGPLDMPASRERLSGFREALAAHGHGEPVHVEGDFTQDGGGAAMRHLLDRCPDLDGVFIASDLMALGALPVLSRSGRRVPEDVAVIGFDDSSAALACDPKLTTVRQPVEDMASEMARLVLRQIAEPAKTMPMVVFRPTLVVRQTA
ncbi:LacI family DNA-binding transcriptional regulator [Kitasatospora sp. NBC_01539]|uniref:LacI family DNA-binding transcriptional regulator n=1 Tax=Kitasatospora sp. NBC_01539 TaxID=2903577 RepID=UPI0038602B14